MSSAFAVEEPTLPHDAWRSRGSAGEPLRLLSGSTRNDTGETIYVTSVLRHPSGRRVALPISVEIHHGSHYVAVLEPRSGIHGAGATEGEAIADFWQAIQDFDEAIGQSRAPNLRALRRILDRLLEA